MCGIFGNITKTVNQLDVSAFNILGIFNIERGKNSCGITYDGEIFHGLDNDKIYSDFIKKRSIKPKKSPILFGHTRAASPGNIVNEYNAHPFGFGTYKEGFEFIGVHNGTLRNHRELARKYNIDLTEEVTQVNNNHSWKKDRDKIDSEILLEILYKTKSYSVLNEYIGGAALIWTWPEEPNKVYLWSGASKKAAEDNEDKIFEERPLCVYVRSKNNMFVSSLKESLYAIGGQEDDVFQIDYNVVYCITDGDFYSANKVHVSRRKASQEEKIINYTGRINGYHHHAESEYYDLYEKNSAQSFIYEKNKNKNIFNPALKNDDKNLDIFKEKPLHETSKYKSRTYFSNLRYWRNGHLINGVYIYIKEWGFKYVGENKEEAKDFLKKVRGLTFSDGDFNYNSSDKNSGMVPYSFKDNGIQLHYFVDGVNLKTYLDYSVCVGKRKNLNNFGVNKTYLNFIDMSHMSKHPLITMNEDPLGRNDLILEEGKVYSGTFSPLGSEKIYSVVSGKLSKIEKRKDLKEIVSNLDDKNNNVIILPKGKSLLENAEDSIIEIEKNISIKEDLEDINKNTISHSSGKALFDDDIFDDCCSLPGTKEVVDSSEEPMEINGDEENELISMYVEEGFEEAAEALVLLNTELESWLPNKKANSAIEIVKDILEVMNEFVVTKLMK